jgi:hypothetical protein
LAPLMFSASFWHPPSYPEIPAYQSISMLALLSGDFQLLWKFSPGNSCCPPESLKCHLLCWRLHLQTLRACFC